MGHKLLAFLIFKFSSLWDGTVSRQGTIIFCIYYSMKPRLLFSWVRQVKAHLNLNVSYPFSKRKQSTSERIGTAGLGKNSAKKTGDLLADRALYIEGKIGICPAACEKNATFFLHSSFWERKQKCPVVSKKLFSSGFLGILLHFLCMVLDWVDSTIPWACSLDGSLFSSSNRRGRWLEASM